MSEANGTPVQAAPIQLPAATEARMRRIAAKVGMSLEDYVRELAKIAGLTEEDFIRELAEGETNPPRPTTVQERMRSRLQSRTEEQILADRERILKTARRARPLPPGKTLEDVVCGLWPGDETDEEINEWLEKLS